MFPGNSMIEIKRFVAVKEMFCFDYQSNAFDKFVGRPGFLCCQIYYSVELIYHSLRRICDRFITLPCKFGFYVQYILLSADRTVA